MAAKKASNKETDTQEVSVTEERQVSEPIKLTPKQALFLQYYLDPESKTWGSARGSALAAGFSESMANQITYLRPKWFVEFCSNTSLIDKIEGHFQEVMNLPNITQAMGAFGPLEKKEVIHEDTGEVYKSGKKKGQPKTKKKTIKVPVYVPNINVIKAKNEVAKIAAPAHDPDRYGKKAGGGNNFIFNMTEDRQKFA